MITVTIEIALLLLGFVVLLGFAKAWSVKKQVQELWREEEEYWRCQSEDMSEVAYFVEEMR